MKLKFLSALEAEILRITYFEGVLDLKKFKDAKPIFFSEYVYRYCKSYLKYSLKD